MRYWQDDAGRTRHGAKFVSGDPFDAYDDEVHIDPASWPHPLRSREQRRRSTIDRHLTSIATPRTEAPFSPRQGALISELRPSRFGALLAEAQRAGCLLVGRWQNWRRS